MISTIVSAILDKDESNCTEVAARLGRMGLDKLSLYAGAVREDGNALWYSSNRVDLTRYVFPDGTAITRYGSDCWGYGFKGCWCVANMGHRWICENKPQPPMAELVISMFGDNRKRDADGKDARAVRWPFRKWPLELIASRMFATKLTYSGFRDDEIKRYVFPDGSVVTDRHGSFGYGFKDCYCLVGEGHLDECVQNGGDHGNQ